MYSGRSASATGPSPEPIRSDSSPDTFTASTEINRSDYGVNFNGPIPGVPGGVAVSEKVTINLEIEGVLQA